MSQFCYFDWAVRVAKWDDTLGQGWLTYDGRVFGAVFGSIDNATCYRTKREAESVALFIAAKHGMVGELAAVEVFITVDHDDGTAQIGPAGSTQSMRMNVTAPGHLREES